MRPYILLPLFLFTNLLVSNAQSKHLEITTKRNSDNTVDFLYKKVDFGSTYISLDFKQITNASSSNTIETTVNGNSGTLLKLRPLNPKQGIRFTFNYTFIMGDHLAKPDHNFVYTLPFKPNNKVIAKDLNNLKKTFGNKTPKNWKAIQFLTQLNDTIYAARKGMVVKVINEYERETDAGYSFKSESNRVIIEHQDGTFAKYDVLRKNSIMVKPGDKVYPTTPLAVAGSYDASKQQQLRFAVYYLDGHPDFKANRDANITNEELFYAYVNPIFYFEGTNATLENQGNYTVKWNDAITTTEMSRREIKRMLKE